MEFITNLIPVEQLKMGLSFIGAFAALASMTPNKADNKIANILLGLVNILGLNIGQAKNNDK